MVQVHREQQMRAEHAATLAARKARQIAVRSAQQAQRAAKRMAMPLDRLAASQDAAMRRVLNDMLHGVLRAAWRTWAANAKLLLQAARHKADMQAAMAAALREKQDELAAQNSSLRLRLDEADGRALARAVGRDGDSD